VNALRAAWATALVAAPEGVYAGTYGGGVALLDPSGAVHDLGGWGGSPGSVRRGAEPPERHVRVNPNALFLDGDRLYVGTLEDGLLVYTRGDRTWHAPDVALGSKNVTAVSATADALWIGTDRGLVRIARALIEGMT
jgi:hypothetical protein